jgi:hypothetical protein
LNVSSGDYYHERRIGQTLFGTYRRPQDLHLFWTLLEVLVDTKKHVSWWEDEGSTNVADGARTNSRQTHTADLKNRTSKFQAPR